MNIGTWIKSIRLIRVKPNTINVRDPYGTNNINMILFFNELLSNVIARYNEIKISNSAR